MTTLDTTHSIPTRPRKTASWLRTSLTLLAALSVFGIQSAQAFPWYGPGADGGSKFYGYSGAGFLAQGEAYDCSSSPCQNTSYYKTDGGDGRQQLQASDIWDPSPAYSNTAMGYANAGAGTLGAWSTTHTTTGYNVGMYGISIMYNTYKVAGPSATQPNVTLNWSLDGNFAHIDSQDEAVLDINVGIKPPWNDYSYNYGDLAGYTNVLYKTAASYTGYMSTSSTVYSDHGTVDLTPILNYITNRYFGGKSFTPGDTFVLEAKLETFAASPVYDPNTGATLSMDNSSDFLHTASFNLSSTSGGVTISAVPAPASFWLYLTGLSGLLLAGRLRRKRS